MRCIGTSHHLIGCYEVVSLELENENAVQNQFKQEDVKKRKAEYNRLWKKVIENLENIYKEP